MATDLQGFAQLVQSLESMRIVTYCDVGSVAMFLYDYMITFGMEVDLVWSSRWGFMKMAYLSQRYMPFIDTVWLCLHHQTGSNLTPKNCHLLYRIRSWMIILGFANSELILTLRAWAVWNRNKYLAIFLPTLCGTAIIANLVVMGIFLKDLKIGPQPYPDFLGCLVSDSNHILYMCWVILTSYEFVILILMIIPGIEAYRLGGDKALYEVVFRDGILSYIYLFALSTLNVVVVFKLPNSYLNLLASPERVLHCLLSSRVLLHIRAQMTVRQSAWSDGFTNIEFNDETNEPIGFRLHPTNSGLSPR